MSLPQPAGAGRHEAAYARMSAAYRQRVTLDRFSATVKAHPYLGAARSVTMRKVRTTRAQTGQAIGFLQTNEGSVDVTFHYTQEAEGWRITGITLAGTAALPTEAATPDARGTAPARPAPAGCGKDTDCKGDRICVKGECVAPK